MAPARLDERRGLGGSERQGRRADERAAKATSSAPTFGQEEYLLGWLFVRPDLRAALDADMIEEHAPPLSPDDFATAENRALLIELTTMPQAIQDATPEDRLISLPEPLWDRARLAVAEVQRKPLLTDEKLVKDLGDSLLRLRERNLRRQMQQVEALIRESEENGEKEQARQLHERMATYATQQLQISMLLNRRSMTGALAQRKPAAESER
jgi:hypothetical protein